MGGGEFKHEIKYTTIVLLQIIVIREIVSRDLILYIMTIATKSTFDLKITLLILNTSSKHKHFTNHKYNVQ